MNINDLTLGQIKEIQNLTVTGVPMQEYALGKYVIIRTYSAGVHAGYLSSRDGMNVVLKDSRRLWKWVGAASLSQLAMEGVKKPNECKFPCAVDRIELTAIEIIDCTEAARKSIEEVPVWSA